MSVEDFFNEVPIDEHPEVENEDHRYRAEEVDVAALEMELANFRDEPPINQEAYPDTASEDEEEEDRNRFATPDIGAEESMLSLGQIFYEKETFSAAVLHHALLTGRNIKRNRYDTRKIGYNCVGGNCNWRVYCAKALQLDYWEIRVYNDEHTCVPNGEWEMMKVPVIAKMFLHKIREELDYFMPMKIQQLIMEIWKINVTRGQCQVARNNALKWIEEEYAVQFKRLRDFAAEILESNPDSSVDVDTERNEDGKDVFKRFYLCFDNVRKSWKENCRPCIGVDGCFLRSKMKGQLLVAIGRDGDNSIYPIAWGVVQVENTDNWSWFLNKLKVDLGLGAGDKYVIVSDRQKGLLNAVEVVLPNIEHRWCVRHIYANLKAKHGKKKCMKELVWGLAWSYNASEYATKLNRLMMLDSGIYEDIVNTRPMSWCRAFYNMDSKCEDVDNNSTESFNALIVKARALPLVPMIEMIARQAMVRICKRSVKAIDHQALCTPYVKETLAKEYKRTAACKVYSSTNQMHQVVDAGISYQVSLGFRTCTCRKRNIRGFPCEHGYAVILHKKLEVEDYVDHWFRTSTWRRTYAEGITPTRGAPFWPTGSGSPVHMPPEPAQPGRKKKTKKDKRKKGVNESPTKKKRLRIMHCGICGSPKHNARRCPKKVRPSVEPSQGESSQVEPSQGVMTQE